MRFILPITFILISIVLFFTIIDPFRAEVMSLRQEIKTYDEALTSSTELEKTFKDLVGNYKLITREDKDKLRKLLPDNVNNIVFVLEIENIANKHGMSLKDVSFDVADKKDEEKDNATEEVVIEQPKDYKDFVVEFNTSGTYDTFLNFLNDLESNLRLVDIQSIQIDADTANKVKFINNLNQLEPINPNVYNYKVKLLTYWLIN